MGRLEEAIGVACAAHDGQLDKNGQPYILHVMRVIMGQPDELHMVVAALHDVVEDSRDWQVSDITSMFGEEVGEAVDALTRRDGEPYLLSYIERISQNPVATQVKKRDLMDNMENWRLRALPKEEQDRLTNKYRDAFSRLFVA
jgi:(p)ppGpp synthase/HD superfamily hydrolase